MRLLGISLIVCLWAGTATATDLRRGCMPRVEALEMLERASATTRFLGFGGEMAPGYQLWIGMEQNWVLMVTDEQESCILDFGNRSVWTPDGLPAGGFARLHREDNEMKP